MKCPCKGCEQRHALCHDDCALYKEWKHSNALDKEYLNSFRLKPKQWRKTIKTDTNLKNMHISSRPKGE